MLSRQLAAHFNTLWIPEFARHYLEVKKNSYDPFGRSAEEICQPQDIPHIVIGQIANEDAFASQASKLLFLDTNPLMTYAYNIYYFHRRDAWIEEVVLSRPYHLYLLMNIDVPWVPDPPFRDRPNHRDELFTLFRDELERHQFPYEIISGSYEQRLQSAITIIQEKFSSILSEAPHEQ